MALQQNKVSRARRDSRRNHHKLVVASGSNCPNCGAVKRSHHVCPACGFYKDREVVKVDE